ncbi:hypothetical protein GGF32_009109 [Allomyces javanicus]|nr:hypothetical protein GGF32_009109 [Allomyces javanicus]
MPLWDVDYFKSTKDPAVLELRQIALANVHLYTPHNKEPCDLLDLNKLVPYTSVLPVLGNVVAQGTLDWGGKMSRECRKAMKQKAKDATGKQSVQFEVMEWSLERKDSEPGIFKFIVWISSGRVWYSIKSISPNWTEYMKTSLVIQTLSALAQIVAHNQTLETTIVLQKVAQALSRSADDIATLLNKQAQFFHTQLLVFVFDHAKPKSIHPKCPILQDLWCVFHHDRAITPSPPPPPLLALASTTPAPDSSSVAGRPRSRLSTPPASRLATAAAAGSARLATPSRPPSRTSSRLRGASPDVVPSDRAESPLSSPPCNPSSPPVDAESLDDQPLSRDPARASSVPAQEADTARNDRVESHVVEPAEPSSDIKVTDFADFGDAEWRDFFGETRHARGASAGAEDGGGVAVAAQQLTVGATRREEQEPAVKREDVVETAVVADVELKAQVRRAEPDLAKSVVVEVPMYPSMRCQFESCIFVGGAWDDLFAHYEKAHDLPFHAPDGAATDVDQDDTEEFVELPPIPIAKRPPLPSAPPRGKLVFRFASLVPPREPPLPVPVPVAKLPVLPPPDERAERMRAFTAMLEPAWSATVEESDDEDGEVAPPCPNESALPGLELADAFDDDDVDMDEADVFPAAAGSLDGPPKPPASDSARSVCPAAVPAASEREPSPPPAPLIDVASDLDAIEDGATVGGDRVHASTAASIALGTAGDVEPLSEATLDAPLPVSEPADVASNVSAVEVAVAGGDHTLAAGAAPVAPNNWPRPRLIDAVGGVAPLLESVTPPGAPAAARDRLDTGWFRSQQPPPNHHGNVAASPPPPPPPARHRPPPPPPPRSRPTHDAPRDAGTGRRTGPADAFQTHRFQKRRSTNIVGDHEDVAVAKRQRRISDYLVDLSPERPAASAAVIVLSDDDDDDDDDDD